MEDALGKIKVFSFSPLHSNEKTVILFASRGISPLREKGTKKHGKESIEYLEADIECDRHVINFLRTMVEAHQDFIKKINKAGYYVFGPEYDEDGLVSIIVGNDIGGNGRMRRGLSPGVLSIPIWMPRDDARLIWDHFNLMWKDKNDELLAEKEKELKEKESQLVEWMEHLKKNGSSNE